MSTERIRLSARTVGPLPRVESRGDQWAAVTSDGAVVVGTRKEAAEAVLEALRWRLALLNRERDMLAAETTHVMRAISYLRTREGV